VTRKNRKKKKHGEAVGTYEKLPNEFLSWSEKKQNKYIHALLQSISPGPVSDSSSPTRDH
jgi:hypothetical protein